MDKKAKKDAIAAGQNVELDGVVVLNDVSVSREKAPSTEEPKVPEEEVASAPSVPATEEPPVQEEKKDEVPEIPVPTIDVPSIEPQVSAETPSVGLNIPNPAPIQVPNALDSTPSYDASSNVLPFNVPGVQDGLGATSQDNGFKGVNSYDNVPSFQTDLNGDASFNSFQNNYDSQVNEQRVPADVKGTLDLLENRFAVIYGENQTLSKRNEDLESQVDAMQKEIMRLRQENASYEETMNRARASILENFGLAGKSFGGSTYHETQGDNTFGGMNRSA